MSDALANRVRGMITRGTVAGVDDDQDMQEIQIELLADETHDAVEHLQSYGFSYRPKAGAELIAFALGGTRSHLVVLSVGDRRYRMKGLQEGEVAIHDDQGQHVLLGRDGIVVSGKKITFESEGDIVFEADGKISASCTDFDVEASGHAIVTASGHAELEGATIDIGSGASLGAARNTDPINDSIDKISGGSSKVKIA